jgi:hypothetical protein
LEFLISTGIAAHGSGPRTLWRLLHGLAELDDSGTVDTLFESSLAGRRGARPDTVAARNLKVAAADGLGIGHRDQPGLATGPLDGGRSELSATIHTGFLARRSRFRRHAFCAVHPKIFSLCVAPVFIMVQS